MFLASKKPVPARPCFLLCALWSEIGFALSRILSSLFFKKRDVKISVYRVRVAFGLVQICSTFAVEINFYHFFDFRIETSIFERGPTPRSLLQLVKTAKCFHLFRSRIPHSNEQLQKIADLENVFNVKNSCKF